MKIGLLAYHSACNFGATLQLLSTYKYLEKNNHTPLIINWIPLDLELFYQRPTPISQYEMQQHLRKTIWQETSLCRTSEDIARVIEEENIEAVIVGSDAVTQHHTLLERMRFPTRKIFTLLDMTSDRIFPNPFWGNFRIYLKKQIPIAYLSVSNQDSIYKYYSKTLKTQMYESIKRFSYISVRDTWTQKMFACISNGKIIPSITPDPVFAFNRNALSLVPKEEDIKKKYELPDKYILLTFENGRGITQEWIDKFVNIALSKGIICVGLPFSNRKGVGKYPKMLDFPLSPLDWYSLIKYSCGYVGNNMHPIVVSLHNANPFFCFDNYGISKLRGLYTSDTSSKIKHILEMAGFGDYRISCIKNTYNVPSPEFVFNKLICFNKEKALSFARMYSEKYDENMIKILKSLESDIL